MANRLHSRADNRAVVGQVVAIQSVNPSGRRNAERSVIGRGQYIGHAGQIHAFVWLDDETAPTAQAANDRIRIS